MERWFSKLPIEITIAWKSRHAPEIRPGRARCARNTPHLLPKISCSSDVPDAPEMDHQEQRFLAMLLMNCDGRDEIPNQRTTKTPPKKKGQNQRTFPLTNN
jgi:hypothetical protein